MDAIISHGCFLRECSVQHSIVGVRSRLEYGVELKVSFPLAQVHVNSFLCPGMSTDLFGYEKNTHISGYYDDGCGLLSN